MIRRANITTDMQAIVRLNKQVFVEHWSADGIGSALQSESYDCFVAVEENNVFAYVLAQRVADEIHIMQIAVAEAYQRQGFAKKLIQQLLHHNPQASTALLEVRASNMVAQKFYQAMGFSITGHRKAYYQPCEGSSEREDALLITKSLII